jgi:hypothetical protein
MGRSAMPALKPSLEIMSSSPAVARCDRAAALATACSRTARCNGVCAGVGAGAGVSMKRASVGVTFVSVIAVATNATQQASRIVALVNIKSHSCTLSVLLEGWLRTALAVRHSALSGVWVRSTASFGSQTAHQTHSRGSPFYQINLSGWVCSANPPLAPRDGPRRSSVRANLRRGECVCVCVMGLCVWLAPHPKSRASHRTQWQGIASVRFEVQIANSFRSAPSPLRDVWSKETPLAQLACQSPQESICS